MEKDLLLHPELLPENVKAIFDTFDEETNDYYNESKRLIIELEKVGYTADYDLSGEIFNLRKL